MARIEGHLLSPLAEAIEWGVTRAAGYFLAWLLGISLPRLVEWLVLGDIAGRRTTFTEDDASAGVIAATHLMHPLGFLILASHIVLFAVFVRFDLRYRWILWPLATGLFWRIFLEQL